MQAELAAAAGRAGDLMDLLDIVRRWANDRLFQIGTHILRGRLSPEEAGPPLADIADVCIGALAPAVQEVFAAAHGRVPGGRLAVLAFGELGSREMTVNSDLDLMLLYDYEGSGSDGPRPLDADTFYARFCRRLMAALTAETAEGGQAGAEGVLAAGEGDGGVGAQTLCVVVSVAAEVSHEALTGGWPGVGDRNDARVRVCPQLGDHVHRPRAEADDAEVEWCVGCHGYAVALWCWTWAVWARSSVMSGLSLLP
jgi:hypothetical protein